MKGGHDGKKLGKNCSTKSDHPKGAKAWRMGDGEERRD